MKIPTQNIDYADAHEETISTDTDVCGDCAYYNGERCTGKFEGHERYAGSSACDEFDCCADYDIGN